MASSPLTESSSGTNRPPFHVFINHRGKDTKHTLARSIYKKLNDYGLRVFLDEDELRHGDFFPKVLENAIANASVHIAIFSENYAQSSWCLAELTSVLETKAIFIPIFYHVDAYVPRWAIEGKGIYGDAFKEYEEKNRFREKLQSWKLALHKASFYTGEIINNQCDEEKALMNVVNHVLKELKRVKLNVEHPVGLDEAERDFHNIVHQYVEPIQIVGILGMGGAGKTTLAKYLYNNKCSLKKSSFIFDVREAAINCQLLKKQKKLLQDLEFQTPNFDNMEEGKEILRNRLESVSVLIVLDDVDHKDQLDALLPARNKLGHGSLIIVTTRELNVLKACDISAIYKMRPLNSSDAKELFCWYAFGQPSPFIDFEELAKKSIKACSGLPLSLKVLGSLLHGQSSKEYWHSQLDKLSRIVPEDIKMKLRISYDALDDEEKEMFLDVACFFIGWPSSSAIAVWDGSGWSGLHGWQRLVDKCLVEFLDNKIRMNDHLRDLGREIANKQSPYRIWSKQQIIQIQPQQKLIPIRGMAYPFGDSCLLQHGKIILNTSQGKRNLPLGSLGLKILICQGYFINEKCSELFTELLCFRCDFYGHINLPSWLPLKKLRILNLSRPQPQKLEDLWECDEDAPPQLRQLIIDGGFGLKKISHLQRLRSVETLSLHRCTELKTLPSLAEATSSLKEIELIECTKLEKIESLESLRSLETLRIYDCTELNTLPSLAEATSLKEIRLASCIKLEKIESLESLRSLEKLTIYNCTELNTLPSLAEATSLKEIELISCTKLEKIESLESLRSLEKLTIKDCTELNTLPSLAEATSSLKEIKLRYCTKLEKIESIESLRSLEKLTIKHCTELNTLPSLAEATFSLKEIKLTNCTKLEKIESLESLRSLEKLRIDHCTELNTLPSLAEATSSLKEIELNSCNKLEKMESLGSLRSLEKIKIDYCTELNTLPNLAEATSSLKEIELSMCTKLEKIESLESLRSLEKLTINDCTELKTLPSLPEATSSLKEIELSSCTQLEKIESLESLRSLEKLTILDCTEFNTLPSLAEATSSLKEIILMSCTKLEKIESLESLRSLEELTIYNCTELNTLPSLGEATSSLKEIVLSRCTKLKKIESLVSLRSLEILKIEDCTELNTLPSLAEATSLKKIELSRCTKLEKIESLESLRSLEKLRIDDCTELNTLPSLAEATSSLKEIVLSSCTKLEKIESLESLRSLEKLRIDKCTELNTLPSLAEATSSLKEIELSSCTKLDTLPSLAELTCLEEFVLTGCKKVEKVEGLEVLRSLKKVKVHMCSMRPSMLKLPQQSKRLESVEVVANRVVIEPSKQKWGREVIICTRAVIDVMSLRNFFTSFPLNNVVGHGSSKGLTFRMPESTDNANAILICFVVDSILPISFQISTDKYNYFCTSEMSKGEWVWMGIFPQESDLLQSQRYEIIGEVEEGWILRGTEQRIREAFSRLSQS